MGFIQSITLLNVRRSISKSWTISNLFISLIIRFKEDSLSSLDTLNDIDTENINVQNIDDNSSLSDYNYSRCENDFNTTTNTQTNQNLHSSKLNHGIEQEWSYSLNNSAYFSQDDQRLMNEIVRMLKPIIKKTVKKQLRYYMEKQMVKELQKNGFMLNTFDSAECLDTMNEFC